MKSTVKPFCNVTLPGSDSSRPGASGCRLLRQAVAEAPSGHFITGIFGTKYVLEALSRYGFSQEVYDIVNSTAYPGWGYMIDQGQPPFGRPGRITPFPTAIQCLDR